MASPFPEPSGTSAPTPTTVIAQMDSTRALDGTRDATWDGMTATWTYHPDDGLDVILTDC